MRVSLNNTAVYQLCLKFPIYADMQDWVDEKPDFQNRMSRKQYLKLVETCAQLLLEVGSIKL